MNFSLYKICYLFPLGDKPKLFYSLLVINTIFVLKVNLVFSSNWSIKVIIISFLSFNIKLFFIPLTLLCHDYTIILVNVNYMLSVSEKKVWFVIWNVNFMRVFLLFFAANKSKVFNNGSNVNLTCSDKTWNEVLHVIWNIYFRDHSCKITFSSSGEAGENSCRDGMSLRNTSSAQSYLYIPNFSTDDVGMYECESVYRGGRENYNINVSITGKTLFWW